VYINMGRRGNQKPCTLTMKMVEDTTVDELVGANLKGIHLLWKNCGKLRDGGENTWCRGRNLNG
jgi:hypothetical protein